MAENLIPISAVKDGAVSFRNTSEPSTVDNKHKSAPKANTNFVSPVNNGAVELESKVKNKIASITADKQSIVPDEITTYTVKLDNKSPDSLEKDLKAVKFCFWLQDKNKKTVRLDIGAGKAATSEKKRGVIRILEKGATTSEDSQLDFFDLSEDESLSKKLVQNGYYYAQISVDTDKKEVTLKVKFSKWLDGYRVRTEAYLLGEKIKGDGGNTTKSLYVKSNPEIIKAYWLNASGVKVKYAGYQQDVYLYLKTLGLTNKILEVHVYDADVHPNPPPRTGTDDRVEWKNNKIKIEKRETIKQFKVGNKDRYEGALSDESAEEIVGLYSFNSKSALDLELYIHIANSNTLNIKPEKQKYGQLRLTSDEELKTAFIAKTKTKKVQGDAPDQPIYYTDKKTGKKKKSSKTKPPVAEVPYYKKLDKGVLGQKVQLVAECVNLEGKEVIFELFEKKTLLADKDQALQVVHDGKEVTEVKAKVENGYAIAEIELSKFDSNTYKAWDKKLDPDEGELKTTELYLKAEATESVFTPVNKWLFLKNKPFELGSATIIYDIYSSGEIEKLMCENPKKVKYIYHDVNGNKHMLGKAKVNKTKRHVKKNVLSNKKNDDVLLAYSKDIQSYSSGNVKFKFLTWNSSSGRWYINIDCFAGLLGAMIEESIEDLGFNGFSIKNGNTAGGSSSHINGEKGDLRYLSTNKNGEVIHLFTNHTTKVQNPNFDYDRQKRFNDALYKYGWGRVAKMYSENFYIEEEKEVVNPKTKRKEIKKIKVKHLLNHCVHKMKIGKNGYRHYHHIHLTGFDHSKIKEK